MIIQNKKILASILFVLISFVCVAQSVPEPVDANRPPPPPGLPIDAGVLVVAGIGLAYGASKVLKNNKAKG